MPPRKAPKAKPTPKTGVPSSPPPKRTRRNKSVDDDVGPSRSKTKSIVAKSMAKSAKSASKSKASSTSVGAVVDKDCSLAGNANVYVVDGVVYDATLNQTNLGTNNNKYYNLQLLVDAKGAHHVWFHWGRVGYKGQSKLQAFSKNLTGAIKEFESKFAAKTGHDFSECDDFEKMPGKYDLVKVDYSATDDVTAEESDDADSKASTPKPEVESKLSTALQTLISLICDVKTMQRACIELDFDTKQAPLGKLSAEQITSGYQALKTIEECIVKKTMGRALIQACEAYYTRIPHKFGMRSPPLINSDIALRNELQLMEALADIEVAMRTLRRSDEESAETDTLPTHPIDRHYAAMQCRLGAFDRDKEQFQMIETYVQNTHAPTHMSYKMRVRNVFDCHKTFGGTDGYDRPKAEKLGNRRLLWHGSRLGNWYGILSQGLRIAPPEAPSTGYMFGKGVYFADVCSKSANYCFATRTNPIGLLLLCDVALGKTWDLVDADHKADGKIAKLDYHSVRGLGKMQPDPKHDKLIADASSSYTMPQGKCVKTLVDNKSGYTLQYNEYVVYDRAVIDLKYLVEVEFIFA